MIVYCSRANEESRGPEGPEYEVESLTYAKALARDWILGGSEDEGWGRFATIVTGSSEWDAAPDPGSDSGVRFLKTWSAR